MYIYSQLRTILDWVKSHKVQALNLHFDIWSQVDPEDSAPILHVTLLKHTLESATEVTLDLRDYWSLFETFILHHSEFVYPKLDLSSAYTGMWSFDLSHNPPAFTHHLEKATTQEFPDNPACFVDLEQEVMYLVDGRSLPVASPPPSSL